MKAKTFTNDQQAHNTRRKMMEKLRIAHLVDEIEEKLGTSVDSEEELQPILLEVLQHLAIGARLWTPSDVDYWFKVTLTRSLSTNT
jgi:hypothetical protein